MKVVKLLTVPTGHIAIVQGTYGNLECLSIGDYGKEVNVKCDTMGLTRKPSPVRHTDLLPLSEKWVITISTQYGCSMKCKFCDVPSVGRGRNANVDDLVGQVQFGLSLHPEVKSSKRLNIHYARMGEPTFNPAVITATNLLYQMYNGRFIVHPVVSTMMPRSNQILKMFLSEWMSIKNDLLAGEAGLQLSINSTDEVVRKEIFGDCALPMHEIANIMNGLPKPVGRKITLNFAIANDWPIDANYLASLFSPEHFLVKLTPMHKTSAALTNDIETSGDYTIYESYEQHEENLKKAGFDVLVFIASTEEDLGRITCGNAILSGNMPNREFILGEQQG